MLATYGAFIQGENKLTYNVHEKLGIKEGGGCLLKGSVFLRVYSIYRTKVILRRKE